MIKNTKFRQDWSLEYQNYILPLFYSKIPDLHIRSIISSPINTNNWISMLNYALKNGYYKKEDKDIIKQIINQPFWSWIDNEYQKPFDQWCKLTQVTF